jgi:negative regulator of sigma-B (phosphoserine phosphatase)
MSAENSNQEKIIDVGIAYRPYPGYVRSGDAYTIQITKTGILVAVVDGLGHGPNAADTAELAITTVNTYSNEPVLKLFQRCHNRLKESWGAAMIIASIVSFTNRITWAAVGNIDGRILRADSHALPHQEVIIPKNGVVGHRLPSIHEFSTFLNFHDMIIFVTDGIRSHFSDVVSLNISSQENADRILNDYARNNDDALVLVIQYIGRTR